MLKSDCVIASDMYLFAITVESHMIICNDNCNSQANTI